MRAIAVSPPTPSQAEQLILVEEISHRLDNEYAQVIAGIRLAAKGIASSEARAALTSAATRLLSYAEAHRAFRPRPIYTAYRGSPAWPCTMPRPLRRERIRRVTALAASRPRQRGPPDVRPSRTCCLRGEHDPREP